MQNTRECKHDITRDKKHVLKKKTHKLSNYLKYYEYLLNTYKKNLKTRYVSV